MIYPELCFPVVETKETFVEEVMLELGLEGKAFFFLILFFWPDAILGLEWD